MWFEEVHANLKRDITSSFQNLLDIFPEIDRIEDKSDFLIKRARIFFKCNKYEMSDDLISAIYAGGSLRLLSLFIK